MTGSGRSEDAFQETLIGDATSSGRTGEEQTSVEREPTRIGRFAVIQRIGMGGMGVVYAAFDPKLDRKIAVKLVRQKLEDHDGTRADEAQARLMREAQAMAKLSHPNVIQVYDVGTHEGQIYIAMEFVDGTTLERWCAEHKPSVRETLDQFARAGRGLAAAHRAGMVHRDFKPENVLVGKDRQVRVLDFGIVRSSHERDSKTGRFDNLSESEIDDELGPMTEAGKLLGTPAYMAPEQITSSHVDARADQFSFCVSLYEALYGERPFPGKRIAPLMFAILQGKVREPPKGSHVPAWIRRVLVRGLHRDREQRFASMDELLAQLARDPARARKRWALSLGGLALLTGAAFGYSEFVGNAGRVCRAGASGFESAWSEARRAEVQSAFEATDLPFAGAALASVNSMLDRHAEAWREMFVASCDLTHEEGGQSEDLLALRQSCLARDRDEVEALVDVLAEADAKVVERAVLATANLPDLDRCADTHRLRTQVPQPEDTATVAAVQEIRSQLDAASAHSSAGKYKDALEMASSALSAAESTAYRPIVAEALNTAAGQLSRNGKYEQAVDNYERSFWLSMAIGHDDAMRAAAIGLLQVVGTRMARPEEGLVWGKHAMAATERLGGLDGLAEARVRHQMGGALRAAGRYQEARENHERALELRTRFHEPDHIAIAATLNNLGTVMANLEDFDVAQDYFERALALFRKLNGDQHPTVGAGLNNIAQLLVLQGKYEEALTPVRQSAEVWSAALGPDHPNLSHPLNTLGLIQARLGEEEKGLVTLARAAAIIEKAFKPGHPQAMTTRTNMATVLIALERFDEAREHMEAAVPAVRARVGDEHDLTAGALEFLAEAMLGQGEIEAARAALTEAISIRTKAVGEDDEHLAETLTLMGRVLVAADDPATAIAQLDRAVALAEPSKDPGRMARAQLALAEAHASLSPSKPDNQAEARSLATKALAVLKRRGVGTRPEIERARRLAD